MAAQIFKYSKSVAYLRSLLNLGPGETEEKVPLRTVSGEIDIVNRDCIGEMYTLFTSKISELKQEQKTLMNNAASAADVALLTERITKAEEALKALQAENDLEAEEDTTKPAQKRKRGGKP
eukprot:gb/GEZN01012176.1/.p1 GENE.gb/GEZN01012176.1/~~gb/GEZN01012176.1/.p1  ORF type:complete len:121 (-),score=21.68 gb/GEZN01012176.1/:302-664(-)